MQIVNGKFENEGMGKHSIGGTETMARRIESLGEDVLKEFQIVVSRIEDELQPDKIRIYYVHDLVEQSNQHLEKGGWKNFHKIVFVSNWQMQRFIEYYGIPWSRCIVLQNAIDPISFDEKKWDNISPGLKKQTDRGKASVRLIYHTTPHRGLEILVPVFDKLCEKFDNIHLDVFSSWKLYGWGQRDEQYQPLFDQCNAHPKITYHGVQENKVIREALSKAHVFAYPSIWPETSCLSLMEAMSAGCICVHSNYAALPETAANWTDMYHYHEDRQEHAKIFYTVLANALGDIADDPKAAYKRVMTQKTYADIFYSWKPNREIQWRALLAMLLQQVENREPEPPEEEMFSYRVG